MQFKGMHLIVAGSKSAITACPHFVPVAEGTGAGAAEWTSVVDTSVVLVVGSPAAGTVSAITLHVGVDAGLRAGDSSGTSLPA